MIKALKYIISLFLVVVVIFFAMNWRRFVSDEFALESVKAHGAYGVFENTATKHYGNFRPYDRWNLIQYKEGELNSEVAVLMANGCIFTLHLKNDLWVCTKMHEKGGGDFFPQSEGYEARRILLIEKN